MSVKISSLNTASTINSGDDINIAGNNPLAFSDWGGGWFMQDSVWIRSYNNKSLWMNVGNIGADGCLTIGYGGAATSAGGAIIAGSVGIGTGSPQKTLDVAIGANNFVTVGAVTSMGTGQWAGIHFGYRENNTLYRKSAIVFERTDNAGGGANAAGKVYILNGPGIGAGSATLADAKLTIDEYGRVGIGNTTPGYTLDVNGTGNFSAALTATKTAKDTYGIQIKGGFYGAPRLQLYDLAVDGNAFLGLGTDMSGGSYESSNYFPRYSGLGRWSVGSWAGAFGTGQYVSGYNEKLWINESSAAFNIPLNVVGALTQSGNQVLHAGNYNSYAPTLTGTGASGTWAINVTGSAGSVAWANISGIPNEIFNYDGWVNSPGYDANTIAGNKSGFTYSNNAPYTGPLTHFAASGYGLQFNASYSGGGTGIGYRTRNGDTATWNSWFTIITSSNIGSQSVSYAANAGTLGTYAETSFIRIAANSSSPTNANFAMGQSSSRNFIQSHAGQPLDLNPLGNAVTINGYVPLTDNNISSYAVKTLATITGNIDSDYGECFVTFDPIPSGTPPLSSPNIRTINVGNSYSRRTQLAFDYASDTAFFRRRTEAGWFTWREFIHSGNIGSQSVSSAATATNISNNGTVTLATATEANSIYITQPSYTTDQPVKLLNFAWYSEVWQLGNIRSSGATTAGFGVFLNGSEKFRFNRDGVAIFGSSGTFASTITATNGIFNNAAGGSIGLKYGGTDDWVVGENAGAATRDFNIYNFNRTSIELSISRATGTATFAGRVSSVAWTTSGRNYSNEWIEFPNYTGLYSANNNAHFYPNGGSYGAWKIQGTRNGWAGLQFDALDNGAVCLMIYPGSNQTGFYNTTYGWQFLWNNGELQVSKNTYGGGTLYTVLDAANYTSYAPTLTGTGASGTWGIDITGNSATASALTSMDISQFTNDSGYVTSASLAGYAPLDGTGATGLWNISITGTADNAYNIIAYLLGTNSVNVNNTASAVYRNENGAGAVLSYAPVLHVAASDTMWQLQGTYGTTGNGTLYFRQGYNGSWGTWLTMISSANISSYLSGVYLPLTGGTLTGTLNGTRAVFSTAINNDYGLSVTNTGTTGAGGLYVNIGTSATGAPIRVDKAGVNIFLMSSTGNITMAGDLAVNGGDIIISSSGGANVFTRYQNGTGNVEWRLAASVFTLVDNVNEISLMEINPNTSGTFLYYPSLTINTSNTSGGVLLFKATLAANTWGIYKNDTTGLTITKNSVTQLGISATGAITLINTLSVTGGYIEVEQYGLSSSTYSAYIRRNDVSSYGAWDITGGKGGYTGALYNTTNLPHIMFGTTNGFGGLYYQTGSRWVLYYNYTDNCLAVGGTTTNATYKMYVTGAIYATGAIVANSDGRNKENVEVVENALEKVTNLRGVTYTKKDQDSGKREMGVIAQEVEPHVPEVVHYSKDADIYGVSYGNFAGLFIEAIKEQQVVINELKAEIEILKNK